ncbi:MAG TPA: tripartite tricarboxylate transporter substrate-binding protein [Candidatus Limnocylindria bacterium]|nr:tripartite tricarboxylate transporter substrate-binding protein [Candidatus Limnocylindria bacterium]
MSSIKPIIFVSALVCCLLAISDAARAQEDPFYVNQQIKVYNRSTPGGGYDLMSRVVARHLGKYLPGSRSVIVVNQPGAGGLVAAAYMYQRAKPDGLSVSLLDRTAPIEQLLRPELAKQADFRRFRYLGSLGKDIPLLMIRKETGIRTFDDLMQSKNKFVPGGTTKSAAGYQIPFAYQLAWNLPFSKWVLGYPGASEQAIAMQRGENDLIGTTVDSVAGLALLREIGNPLVIASRTRDKRFPEVPTVFEVAKRHKPNSQYWPLVELLVDASEWGRPFVAPPATPEPRVAVLRDAFDKTFKDRALIADAEKVALYVDPVTGATQEELIRKTMESLGASPPRMKLLKMLLE